MKKKKVTINNTESYTINSKNVGYDFKIDIAFPKGYTESNEIYPVIYVLDGNRNFGLVTGISRLLLTGMDAPKMIVVGVGYNTDDEHVKYRSRDYLPTCSSQLDFSGGAPEFLSFLDEELIPSIEQKYRVNETRILSGCSYSGLFTMYTLFTKPSLFTDYIIGSPSLYYDNEVLFDFEEKYAKVHTDLKAKVYLSVGTLEEGFDLFPKMVTNVERMANILQNRPYPNLKLTTDIYEDETHFSAMPITFNRGLRVLIGSLSNT